MAIASNVPQIANLIRQLLDIGYSQAAQATMEAIAAQSTSGVMALRLTQLDEEVERLNADGKKLTSENPVLAAALGELETVLAADAARLNAIAQTIQQSGINSANILVPQITFTGLPVTPLQMGWNQPDPEAIATAVDFASSDAWNAELAKYQEKAGNVARNTAINGIARGKNPRVIARELRRVIEELPVSSANNLARTLQLSSYRQATAVNQLENAAILTAQIRVATLDSRTCMTCVVLNGDVMEVGEVVLDHHQGRCTAISIVKGYPRSIPSGEDWFNQQDEAEQRKMMGHDAYDLWRQGRFDLRDFVQPYDDDVFGQMVRQKSLKNILAEVS